MAKGKNEVRLEGQLGSVRGIVKNNKRFAFCSVVVIGEKRVDVCELCAFDENAVAQLDKCVPGEQVAVLGRVTQNQKKGGVNVEIVAVTPLK